MRVRERESEDKGIKKRKWGRQTTVEERWGEIKCYKNMESRKLQVRSIKATLKLMITNGKQKKKKNTQ